MVSVTYNVFRYFLWTKKERDNEGYVTVRSNPEIHINKDLFWTQVTFNVVH